MSCTQGLRLVGGRWPGRGVGPCQPWHLVCGRSVVSSPCWLAGSWYLCCMRACVPANATCPPAQDAEALGLSEMNLLICTKLAAWPARFSMRPAWGHPSSGSNGVQRSPVGGRKGAQRVMWRPSLSSLGEDGGEGVC